MSLTEILIIHIQYNKYNYFYFLSTLSSRNNDINYAIM